MTPECCVCGHTDDEERLIQCGRCWDFTCKGECIEAHDRKGCNEVQYDHRFHYHA